MNYDFNQTKTTTDAAKAFGEKLAYQQTGEAIRGLSGSNSIGGALGQATPETRPGEIPQFLDEQRIKIDALEGSLAILGKRLVPAFDYAAITRDTPPKPAGASNPKRPTRSQLAAGIDNNNDRLDYLSSCVSEMLENLCL